MTKRMGTRAKRYFRIKRDSCVITLANCFFTYSLLLYAKDCFKAVFWFERLYVKDCFKAVYSFERLYVKDCFRAVYSFERLYVKDCFKAVYSFERLYVKDCFKAVYSFERLYVKDCFKAVYSFESLYVKDCFKAVYSFERYNAKRTWPVSFVFPDMYSFMFFLVIDVVLCWTIGYNILREKSLASSEIFHWFIETIPIWLKPRT